MGKPINVRQFVNTVVVQAENFQNFAENNHDLSDIDLTARDWFEQFAEWLAVTGKWQ